MPDEKTPEQATPGAESAPVTDVAPGPSEHPSAGKTNWIRRGSIAGVILLFVVFPLALVLCGGGDEGSMESIPVNACAAVAECWDGFNAWEDQGYYLTPIAASYFSGNPVVAGNELFAYLVIHEADPCDVWIEGHVGNPSTYEFHLERPMNETWTDDSGNPRYNDVDHVFSGECEVKRELHGTTPDNSYGNSSTPETTSSTVEVPKTT